MKRIKKAILKSPSKSEINHKDEPLETTEMIGTVSNDMIEVVSMDDVDDDNSSDEHEGQTYINKNIVMSRKLLDTDLSAEEQRSDSFRYKLTYNNEPQILNLNHATNNNDGLPLPELEDFNHFQYWREPVPLLDIDLEDILLDTQQVQASAGMKHLGNSDQSQLKNATDTNEYFMQTSQAFNNFQYWKDPIPDLYFKCGNLKLETKQTKASRNIRNGGKTCIKDRNECKENIDSRVEIALKEQLEANLQCFKLLEETENILATNCNEK